VWVVGGVVRCAVGTLEKWGGPTKFPKQSVSEAGQRITYDFADIMNGGMISHGF
jgi:hypothetical protein